jgi:hypothetical protein
MNDSLRPKAQREGFAAPAAPANQSRRIFSALEIQDDRRSHFEPETLSHNHLLLHRAYEHFAVAG